MTVKKLVKLAAESAEDTAKFITKDIQDLAVKHGWDSEAVNGVAVKYEDSSFSFDIDSEVNDSVTRLEYGTERIPPAPVLRKYGSNTKPAEKVLIRGLEKRFGILL